jgi:hypothetical protein
VELDLAVPNPAAMYKLLAGQLYTHVHDIFEMRRPAADYKG